MTKILRSNEELYNELPIRMSVVSPTGLIRDLSFDLCVEGYTVPNLSLGCKTTACSMW